jgi:predicted MFS family arabinose efflux permease
VVRGEKNVVNRALMLAFGIMFGGTTSFYMLLSVVPLYVTGVAGETAAGFATGVLMFATVATELATPRLVDKFGFRAVLAVGLFLLGAPALALPAAENLPAIFLICAVRGVGFALLVVVGNALVASLVPDDRRGEGLGLLGVVVGIPAVVALPLGVWLASHVGFTPAFVAGALTSLVTVAAVPGLPLRDAPSEAAVGIVDGLRTPELLRPSTVFAAIAMASGVIVTFLPLAITRSSGNVAAAGLLVHAVAATWSRWWAGRHGDKHGAPRLLIPGVVATAAGVFALVVSEATPVVMTGMLIFGAGLGISQIATLAMMYERVTTSGYGAVSALWNLAYDAGIGFGAVAFGGIVGLTGYSTAFALTSAVVLAAIAPAIADRAATAESRATEADSY